MESFAVQTTYAGQTLEDALNNVSSERKPIIENLLYEKSSLLLYADDGVGKSVLALQILMQATHNSSKVFDEFEVFGDNKVLLFQLERHPDENFERMKYLRNCVPFNLPNFALSVALQGTNLQDPKMRADAIAKVEKTIDEIGFVPNIIGFDPIYTLVPDDLATAPACNAITSFFRIIQLGTSASIIATSHTNRGIRNFKTGKREAKDMYGNRFLSAFFTGTYHVEPSDEEGAGSIWTRGKNSQKNLEKKFELVYDASCYRSFVRSEGKLSKKDKLDMFLKTCKNTDKEFDYDQMRAVSGLSDSAMRGYLSGYLKEIIKTTSKLSYGKLLYKVL